MEYAGKLEQLEAQFDEMTLQVSDPAVIADNARYRKLAKAHSDLAEIVEKYRSWKQLRTDIAGARSMLEESDPEMRELARVEQIGRASCRERVYVLV